MIFPVCVVRGSGGGEERAVREDFTESTKSESSENACIHIEVSNKKV